MEPNRAMWGVSGAAWEASGPRHVGSEWEAYGVGGVRAGGFPSPQGSLCSRRPSHMTTFVGITLRDPDRIRH